jgi:hypothetical protein
LWEEKSQQGAKQLGIPLAKPPSQRSAPEKVWLAALMKLGTSVSNGDMPPLANQAGGAEVPQTQVVLNWFEELKRRVPVK